MVTLAAHEAFHEALLDDDPTALYDKAPCGYLSTAPDGGIVKVNATFLTWTGYTAGDLVGHGRLAELLTPGGRVYFETHVSPMLHSSGQVGEIALDLLVAGGGRMPVLLNAMLERDLDGEPRIVRYAIFDATERRRYEQELLLAKERAERSEGRAVRLAQTLQQTLIPPTLPSIPGLEVVAAYRPAGLGDEVGGDFYDVFQVAEGEWVAVLGDVCGKGAEAAVVTALVRHSVRALAVSEHSPRALLHQLNAILLASESDRFCTAAVLRLRLGADGWEVTASSGGHPLPLLLRPGSAPEPFGAFGTFVGAFEEAHFDETTTILTAGESLFLHTDGVTEARRGQEFFGEERLRKALDEPATRQELVDGVRDQALAFQHDLPRDDIALLCLGVPG